MQQYFDNILTKYQCGLRTGCNLEYCLITMIEKWLESVDKGWSFWRFINWFIKSYLLSCT